MKSIFIASFFIFCHFSDLFSQRSIVTDVLVVGGGAGGTAAAIQSAREGVRTILVEPTTMLGGMLAAAGVSCSDGNDSLAGGFWKSFRDALHNHYGTKDLATGWVSETCFEPHVADSIFKSWAAGEKRLSVFWRWHFQKVLKENNKVLGAVFKNEKGETIAIRALVTLDATELGDVLANAGAAFDVGTEDAWYSKEKMAPGKTDIIQDITWAAILKDYGKGADKTIGKPAGYRQELYYCCCTSAPCTDIAYKTDAEGMLNYGKLPGNKYMINWPAHGNDSYMNVISERASDREKHYELAKKHTLGFIYFIQTVLGFKNLGLADDELSNGLALIPYNREGRRVVGVVRFNVNHIIDPYAQEEKLYRTGIASGDYPVDHHHGQNPATPVIQFPPIPSFNIPIGVLVPATIDGLIVCEKGISVSNIVNGATRLQPVVLLTGQAAGVLAGWCVNNHMQPRHADTRFIQQELLKDKSYLMPYVDVPLSDSAWESIQRVGLTGILRGVGKPQGWANKTFFYPDSTVTRLEFLHNFHFFDSFPESGSVDSILSVSDACTLLHSYLTFKHIRKVGPAEKIQEICSSAGLSIFDPSKPITRKELAILLDRYVHVFHIKKVNLKGEWK